MKEYFKALEDKINDLSNEINKYKKIDKNVNAECIKKKHVLNMLDGIESDEDLLNVLYKLKHKTFALAREAMEIINFIENNK